MRKFCYRCYQDGKKCEYATPKFNDNAELIPEPNDKIKERFGGRIAKDVLDNSWDICYGCPRLVGSISSTCRGILVVEVGGAVEKL